MHATPASTRYDSMTYHRCGRSGSAARHFPRAVAHFGGVDPSPMPGTWSLRADLGITPTIWATTVRRRARLRKPSAASLQQDLRDYRDR